MTTRPSFASTFRIRLASLQPVILGAGRPFFPPLDERVGLRLLETRTFRSGVVSLRYETVGRAG